MTNNNQNEINHCCYFNNAGQARLSAAVQFTGIQSLTNGWQGSPDDQHRVRALFAQLIHAPTSDIAIVPSTAFAMTLAARNVERLHPNGGKILLLEDQFPSAVYPWQALCHESDNQKWSLDIVRYPQALPSTFITQQDWVHVRPSSSSSPRNWTEAILSHLKQQPNQSPCNQIRVVCVPPLHWSGIGGTLIDMLKISQVCQQHNILLVVDATQAIGVAPFHIQPLLPALTMVACSSHKWLRGPPGTCLVYTNPLLHQNWKPLDQHHRSRQASSNYFTPSPDSRNQMNIPCGYSEAFVGDARKFDAGGAPNPVLLPMLRAALQEVTQLSVERVQEQLQELLQPLLEWARERGIALLTDCELPHNREADIRFYHIVNLVLGDKTPEEMVQLCQDLMTHYNVFTAVRCGGLRISPYLDNTKEDIQQLIYGLNELIFV